MIMPVGPYDIALAKEELVSMAAAENEMRKDKELDLREEKSILSKAKGGQRSIGRSNGALQKKHIDEELDKWERGDWNPKDHRSSMDEVMRKIKERYQFKEDDLL